MNTENVVKNLRVLWRTDRIIADIRMRHLLVGLGLRAFAALIAAFGLLMLELSAYFALVQIWSAISAAAILGVVNFVIAAVLFVIAATAASGPRTRARQRNSWLRGRCAANRGTGGAVAVLRHGPSSAEQRPADAAGAADHDHRQEPEEIQGHGRACGSHQRANTDHRGGIGLTPHNPRSVTDMSKPQLKPILNASLPAQFRQIRIALAREPGHPEGDDEIAYIFVAPLDAEGRIDPKLWREHRDACRVARQRPDEAGPARSSRLSPGRCLGFPL